jgi:hypothetical protein
MIDVHPQAVDIHLADQGIQKGTRIFFFVIVETHMWAICKAVPVVMIKIL